MMIENIELASVSDQEKYWWATWISTEIEESLSSYPTYLIENIFLITQLVETPVNVR